MNQDRREPTISPVRPEHDEIRRHQQSRGSQSSGRMSKGSVRAQAPGVQRTGFPILASFALSFGIIAGAVAAYSTWETMQLKLQLSDYEKRIVSLEDRLTLSGDESEASVAALQAKLKWADSEIRKLWGVSYDTNRKTIESNKQALTKLDKKLATVQDGLKKESALLKTQITKTSSTINALREGALRNSTQVSMLVDQMEHLESSESQLSLRVNANEQAIKAIDNFRRSVNADILQLRQVLAQP